MTGSEHPEKNSRLPAKFNEIQEEKKKWKKKISERAPRRIFFQKCTDVNKKMHFQIKKKKNQHRENTDSDPPKNTFFMKRKYLEHFL